MRHRPGGGYLITGEQKVRVNRISPQSVKRENYRKAFEYFVCEFRPTLSELMKSLQTKNNAINIRIGVLYKIKRPSTTQIFSHLFLQSDLAELRDQGQSMRET